MKQLKQSISVICILFLLFANLGFQTVNAMLPPSTEAPVISKPELQILSTDTYRVYAQKENTILIKVDNTSRFTANNIEIRPNLNPEKQIQGVRILSPILRPNGNSISPSSSLEYELKMFVEENVKEGVYPIYLDVTYKNTSGNDFKSNLLIYYEVRKDDSQLEQVYLSHDNFSEVKPEADSHLTLEYRVENKTGYTIKNLKTYIEGLPAEFTLKSGSAVSALGNVKPFIYGKAEFHYYLRSDIKSGSYPFKVVFEYENKDGQRIVRQESYNLFIAPDQTSKPANTLRYSNLNYPKEVLKEQEFGVSFRVENIGDKNLKDVMIKLIDNPVFLPKTLSIVRVSELVKGDAYDFQIKLTASGDNLKSRNYPINFEISYHNGNQEGKQVVDIHTLGINVIGEDETGEKDKNLPKLILGPYKVEPSVVQAGQEFDLDLEIFNTNKEKDVYNVKAFLTFDVATGKQTVSQNVFSPVNSSNTFYFDKISAKGTVNQKMRMYVVPDAEQKMYMIKVNFEYEDKNGKQIAGDQSIGISVVQPTRVETSELTMPTNVMQNDELSASFNLYNSGKNKVLNLIINTVGNFQAEPNNQFIGNFEPGQSNSYEGYLRFPEPGEQNCKFVISYEDQIGQKYTIEKEFTVFVEEAMVGPLPIDTFPADEMPMPGEPSSGLPWKWIIGGGVGVVVLLVVILTVLRKRKHKKEMNSYEEK